MKFCFSRFRERKRGEIRNSNFTMTIFYDVIFLLFSIVYLPYLLFTGRYHKDFLQRFGLYPRDIINGLKDKDIIWVHAVSVGEVMAARILCQSLLERYPQKRVVISTITKTGNDTAKRFFKDKAVILYLPVDISLILNRVFGRITPKVFIIVETEIWPNLIIALHKKAIPIILANGRISPTSYRHYMKIRFLIKGILNRITLFLMQNNEYADRIKDMGAPVNKVVVTGNMKFDAVYTSGRLDTEALRNDLNLQKDESLFIAASTHKPEEEIVIRVYKDLLKDSPNLRLLIAPRHIERTQRIENLVRKFGFTPLRISRMTNNEQRTTDNEPAILILDTMGRLNRLFSIGTIVFMGGSLMRKGGQNILEPAIFSKPIIFGPHMFNFKDMAEEFLRSDAACMVNDRKGLFESSSSLLKDSRRREELGNHARLLIEKNRGATQRNIEEIDKLLKSDSHINYI